MEVLVKTEYKRDIVWKRADQMGIKLFFTNAGGPVFRKNITRGHYNCYSNWSDGRRITVEEFMDEKIHNRHAKS